MSLVDKMKKQIECKFRGDKLKHVYLCKLNFYGGQVTDGMCRKCIAANENNEDYARSLFLREQKSHPHGVKRISGCCDRADQA